MNFLTYLFNYFSDDKYFDTSSNSSVLLNNDSQVKPDQINDNQIQMPLSEVCFFLYLFKMKISI